MKTKLYSLVFCSVIIGVILINIKYPFLDILGAILFLGGLLYPFVDRIVEERRISQRRPPFESIEREIASLNPDRGGELDSGVKGLELKVGDHILFLVLSDNRRHLQILEDMVKAGLENGEHCGFAVSEESTRVEVLEKFGNHPRLVVIVRGQIRYPQKGIFFTEALYPVVKEAATYFEKSGEKCHLLRIVSEITSELFYSNNNEEFLKYENYLKPNWHRVLQSIPFSRGVPFVMICTYKKQHLLEWVGTGNGDRKRSLINLLTQILGVHDKVTVLTEDDKLITDDEEARKYALTDLGAI